MAAEHRPQQGPVAERSGAGGLMSGQRWMYTNLYNAIISKASPLRAYLNETFPNRRPLQDRYRIGGGEIVVEGSPEHSPGTVGTAFDTMIKLRYDGGKPPTAVVFGAMRIAEAVEESLSINLEPQDGLVGIITGKHELDTRDADTRRRLAWIYAWCTEAARAPVMNETFVEAVRAAKGQPSIEQLIDMAPASALNDLEQLDGLAEERLYPHLGVAPICEPRFEGSRLCSADADFINEGTLFEIKATVGVRTAGKRRVALTSEYLNQMIAYALFDTHDEYGINALALYSARFGYYARWSLDDLLLEMGGRPVDVATERATVWDLLGGDDAIARKYARIALAAAERSPS